MESATYYQKLLAHDQALEQKAKTKTAKSNFWPVFWMSLFPVAVASLFLFRQSLQLDESQSLWQTSRSVPKMLQLVAQDVHVPLYHIMLHFWQVFLGNGVTTARALSLIFFVATIPAIYGLGKEAYGKSVALFGTLLTAISPFLNWYGSVARMYSLMVFLAVLNQYFFVRLFKKSSAGVWWGYFITALLGMFTHYFFSLELIAQMIFFFGHRELFPKNALKNFVRIVVVLALCMAPWLYLVFHLGFASTTQPLLGRPNTFTIFNTFSEFFFGFQNDHLNTILVSLWPVSMLVAIFALRKDRRVGERRNVSKYSVYFLISAIFPIAIVFAVSLVKPIYLSRYLILTIPSLYLFLSWVINNFPVRVARFVRVALVIGILGTFAVQTVSATTPVKEDYKQAVDYISQSAGEQDVVILSSPFTIYPVEYYYHGPAQIVTLPIWDRYSSVFPRFSSSTLPGEVSADTANHRNAYVLLSLDQGYNEQVRLYFETHYQRIDQKDFSPGMALYVYKIRY